MHQAGKCCLVWFRDDLRIADNPALTRALETGLPVIACFILDETAGRIRGAASRWWLAQSLRALEHSLRLLNIHLLLRKGSALTLIPETVHETGAEYLFWNRRYDAQSRTLDQTLKTTMAQRGMPVQSFKGALLWEPWELAPKSSTFYKVFTPFWKAARARNDVLPPLPLPTQPAPSFKGALPASDRLESWGLEPHSPDWAAGFRCWQPGEAGAWQRLEHFVELLDSYAQTRDRPDLEHTSSLSPFLRFGEISPRAIWHTILNASLAQHGQITASAEKFLSELGWREFSYHLLYHLPPLHEHAIQRNFEEFPWQPDPISFKRWTQGRTGYPLVDAGMRQLWQTGWMHNRVRMVAASFLVKHLAQDWRSGEQWFWDTLVDADPASNPASWQWVAGCGADAAPFFRIFNPVTQSEKFDPAGDYIRTFLPELARIPAPLIHKPWTLTTAEQARYGVTLGKDYPMPIVDHAPARQRALQLYQNMRDNRLSDDSETHDF